MDNYQPRSFRFLPPVVKNLLILNIILFIGKNVFEHSLHIDLGDKLGLHYPGSEKFQVYQFITYIFMHGDFWHIFFNMFGLYMFGSVLEQYWGPKKFLIFYFFTGIGAALTHYSIAYFQVHHITDLVNAYLAAPDINTFEYLVKSGKLPMTSMEAIQHFNEMTIKYNQLRSSGATSEAINLSISYLETFKTDYLNAMVVVGASGSLMGLLLAFGVLFPNTLLVALFFPVPIKAKYFVMIYGGIELFSGIRNNPEDNVAHFAHLGGMLFGFILLYIWKKTDRKHLY